MGGMAQKKDELWGFMAGEAGEVDTGDRERARRSRLS